MSDGLIGALFRLSVLPLFSPGGGIPRSQLALGTLWAKRIPSLVEGQVWGVGEDGVSSSHTELSALPHLLCGSPYNLGGSFTASWTGLWLFQIFLHYSAVWVLPPKGFVAEVTISAHPPTPPLAFTFQPCAWQIKTFPITPSPLVGVTGEMESKHLSLLLYNPTISKFPLPTETA